jgi:hypothetical protein
LTQQEKLISILPQLRAAFQSAAARLRFCAPELCAHKVFALKKSPLKADRSSFARFKGVTENAYGTAKPEIESASAAFSRESLINKYKNPHQSLQMRAFDADFLYS